MHLLFPSLCLHCKCPTKQLVCETCSLFFEFLPNTGKNRSACFLDIEAVSTFVQQLRRQDANRLRKAAAAFLVIQFARLKWPMPDLVTSVPSRKLWIPNLSEDLAKRFAQELALPYKKLVKRKFGELPQAESPQFFIKEKVEAKRILIIDDFMQREITLKTLANLLQKELGAIVYGLVISQRVPLSHGHQASHPHPHRSSSQ